MNPIEGRVIISQAARDRRNFLFFVILILFVFSTHPVTGQTEAKRVERLSGLAKIWGAVKFFHPFPAYREIDWDKALIETIPKVNAAKSPEEYAAALNSMLDSLGDKNTRAEVWKTTPETKNESSTQTEKQASSFENGILTIDVYAASTALAKIENQAVVPAIHKMIESFPQAKAVILDMRFSADANDEAAFYYADTFLRIALPQMLDKPLTLSASRYRVHNGYESQTGSGASFYSSAMVTTASKIMSGNSRSKTPPVIVLVNENSPNAEIISGLQSAKIAFVIQDGESSEEAGVTATTLKLPDNIKVQMRTAELVSADGSIGLTADLTAPKNESDKAAQKIIAQNKFVSNSDKTASNYVAQISRKDAPYTEMEFPESEYRLLALFRFWNVINYFFPYKDLIGTDWDTILPKYIPQFEADKNADDYRLTVGKMVAEIHDSHGFIRFPPLKNPTVFYFPPTVEGYTEDQTYIRAVLDETSGFKVGDVVLEVDGEPIEKIRERFAVRTAASTPQALMRQVHRMGIFRGAKDSKAVFKVRGLDGKERTIETVRSVAQTDPRFAQFDFGKRQTPVFSILPSGFGYVDLDRLTNAEVDKMFETIKDAPAVIFDMRGYPNGTAWTVAPRLTTKKSPIAALFSRPMPEAISFNDGETITYNFTQRVPETLGETYKGKVVMLINENAQSQSEHTALFFETARPDIVFIGTPTAGANGDVTQLILPGSIVVSFSGHSVCHADGRQLQRLGIQPTIKVAPTIRGIVGGKDEILDAAVKFLEENKK